MSFMKKLFEMIPNLDPKSISVVEVEVPFEDIGIRTKEDCDLLLGMMDQEETHEKAVNSILDHRNSL